MTNIIIDYRMRGGVMDDDSIATTADNCITIPMMDQIADDLLQYQRDSVYAAANCRIHKLVNILALVQGYTKAEFLHAERVIDNDD